MKGLAIMTRGWALQGTVTTGVEPLSSASSAGRASLSGERVARSLLTCEHRGRGASLTQEKHPRSMAVLGQHLRSEAY